MRIKSLHIDGFGIYRDQSFPLPEHSITVFHGPNEAGKSTVLEFIRMVLFGFPRRHAEQHYPALAGGRHGGRVEILSDDGQCFTFERHRGPHGGQLNVRSDGQDVHDLALIARLRGDLKAADFQAILAFDLESLKGLDGDITSAFYSAGIGATQLPTALKNLEDHHKRIYTQSGRKQKVATVLATLTTLDTQLRKAEGQSKEYRSTRRRLDELAAAIATTDQTQDRARREREERCRYQKAWPTWVELQDIQTQLSRSSIQGGFPDDPLIRLDNLETHIAENEDNLKQIRLKLSDATGSANRPIHNEALVEEDARCKSLTERRKSYQDWCRDLPTQKGLLKKEEAAVAELLQALGSDWNKERVGSVDLSLTARDAIEGWKERLNALQETQRGIDQELSRLDQACQTAEHALAHAQDKLNPDLADGLDDKIALLHDARQCWDKYQKAKQRLEALEDVANDDTALPDHRFPMVGVGVVVALLMFSFVLDLPWYVPGGSLALLLLLLLRWQFGKSPKDTSPIADRVATASKLVDEARRSYGKVLAALDVSLKDVDRVDLAVLDQIGERLNEERKLRQALKTAMTDLDIQQKDRTTCRDQRDQQQCDIDAATDEWSTWLIEQGLPRTLRVDTVPEFVAKIEQGRTALTAVKARKDRIYGIQKGIDEYEDDVKAVADKKTISLDVSQSDVGVTADQIIALRVEVQTAVRDRKAMTARARELTIESKTAEGKVSRLEKRRDELLGAGGTTNPEDFRVKAKEFMDYQQATATRDTLRKTLRAAWMGWHDIDVLEKMFLDTTIDEVNDEITRLDSQLQELRALQPVQREEQAELAAKLQRLLSDEDSSQWRAQREELREELRALARQWSTLVVAQSLLEQARTKYEEERQPDVVRHATTWFERISNGRYKNILMGVGGQREISVVDRAERKKAPDQLSRGTRDQLYLALRFGLIQNIGDRGERLPVVVDEVLVNCDPARAKVVVDAFVELARTTQVLVLTCHPWIVNLFKAASQDVEVVEMASG